MTLTIAQLIKRFFDRVESVTPTVRRGKSHYFRIQQYYKIRVTEDGIIRLQYIPNTTINYELTYDKNTDKFTYFYNTKIFGSTQMRRGLIEYSKLKKCSTEEGYFLESTVQDLTDIEADAIVMFLAFADHCYNLMYSNRRE